MVNVSLSNGRGWDKTIYLPQSWPEVPRRLLRPALRAAFGPGDPALARVRLLDVFGLPTKLAFQIDPVSLHAISAQVSWAHEPCSDMPFTEVDHAGMTLTLPGHGFEVGTCLEWALAEEYFDSVVKDGNTESLLLLCATLLRHTRAGTRERIIDRNHVSAHATAIKTLPDWIQTATLLYMAGVKSRVHDTYNEWLFKPADEGAPASGPDFGWWGTYMSVAEAGVFGAYEQVLQTGFHTVCVYLVQRKKEADEAKRRMKNPNALAL